MFIHIGGDVMVRISDIIGIFDSEAEFYSTVPEQPYTQHSSRHTSASGEIKSVIVTDKGIYTSQVSSLTLKKRAQNLNFVMDEAD